MRKLAFVILLATAAAPAMAQDRERGGRQPRNDDAEQTDAAPQRDGRNPAARSAGGQRTDRGDSERPRGFERIREQREQRLQAATTTPPPASPAAGEDRVR